MKIRIKGNSIRLRLSKSEVEEFGKKGHIQEQTKFGTSVLTYALKMTENKEMTASLEGNSIIMYLPQDKAIEWVQSNKVGFDAEMKNGESNGLYLLLEKDFKCLDNTNEDQSDNYENPLAAQFNKGINE